MDGGSSARGSGHRRRWNPARRSSGGDLGRTTFADGGKTQPLAANSDQTSTAGGTTAGDRRRRDGQWQDRSGDAVGRAPDGRQARRWFVLRAADNGNRERYVCTPQRDLPAAVRARGNSVARPR